jgi:hypothetical protein
VGGVSFDHDLSRYKPGYKGKKNAFNINESLYFSTGPYDVAFGGSATIGNAQSTFWHKRVFTSVFSESCHELRSVPHQTKRVTVPVDVFRCTALAPAYPPGFEYEWSFVEVSGKRTR